jgi:hypothetical protein
MPNWLTQQEIEDFPGLAEERRAALVCARELGACVALATDPPSCEIAYEDDAWTSEGVSVDDAAANALARLDARLAEMG